MKKRLFYLAHTLIGRAHTARADLSSCIKSASPFILDFQMRLLETASDTGQRRREREREANDKRSARQAASSFQTSLWLHFNIHINAHRY